MELSFSFPLYGHDFLALCIHCRINFFNIFVCTLLNLIFKLFDLVFRYILFCKFLKCIVPLSVQGKQDGSLYHRCLGLIQGQK